MADKKALTISGCVFAVLGIVFATIAVILMTIYFRKGQISDTKLESPQEIIVEDLKDSDESSTSAIDD